MRTGFINRGAAPAGARLRIAGCGRLRPHTVSGRSLRDPQKRPPQKPLIGIGFYGEGIRNAAPIERISYQSVSSRSGRRFGAGSASKQKL
jgi:hypothetical protein